LAPESARQAVSEFARLAMTGYGGPGDED